MEQDEESSEYRCEVQNTELEEESSDSENLSQIYTSRSQLSVPSFVTYASKLLPFTVCLSAESS